MAETKPQRSFNLTRYVSVRELPVGKRTPLTACKTGVYGWAVFSWLENLGFPTFLILIGAILSAVGAFWASHQQARKSDEIAALNKEIAGHQRELSKELEKQVEL